MRAAPLTLFGHRLHAGHAILALMLSAAALLGLRLVHTLRAPLPPLPPMVEPAVADRALLARRDPFFARQPDGADLPVTALPLSLHGVRTEAATGRGAAIIALADGQQTVFAVGEAITDGVTLAAIAIDHVVLDRGGTREALWLAGGAGGIGGEAGPVQPVFQPPPTTADAGPPPPEALRSNADMAAADPEEGGAP